MRQVLTNYWSVRGPLEGGVFELPLTDARGGGANANVHGRVRKSARQPALSGVGVGRGGAFETVSRSKKFRALSRSAMESHAAGGCRVRPGIGASVRRKASVDRPAA